jgi:hypothetical protein
MQLGRYADLTGALQLGNWCTLAVSGTEHMQTLRNEAQARIRGDQCLGCIMGFHALQSEFEAQVGANAIVAEAMALDAAERLQRSLQRASEQVSSNAGASISTEGVLALLEVLAFWQVLVSDTCAPLLSLGRVVAGPLLNMTWCEHLVIGVLALCFVSYACPVTVRSPSVSTILLNRPILVPIPHYPAT